jgi:hypothetical protein
MTELHGRVRERLRAQILASGGSPDFEDPELFGDVEALLHTAASTFDSTKLILPEILGDPDTWRLSTTMRYQSHRTKGPASVLMFVKRRVLMPVGRGKYRNYHFCFGFRLYYDSWNGLLWKAMFYLLGWHKIFPIL